MKHDTEKTTIETVNLAPSWETAMRIHALALLNCQPASENKLVSDLIGEGKRIDRAMAAMAEIERERRGLKAAALELDKLLCELHDEDSTSPQFRIFDDNTSGLPEVWDRLRAQLLPSERNEPGPYTDLVCKEE